MSTKTRKRKKERKQKKNTQQQEESLEILQETFSFPFLVLAFWGWKRHKLENMSLCSH